MEKVKNVLIVLATNLVIVLTILVFNDKTIGLDYQIFNLIHDISKQEYPLLFMIISDFGILLGMILMLIILLVKPTTRQFISATYNFLIIILANFTIKNLFRRMRPDWSLLSLAGYSYPSAHTMIGTIIYIYLIRLVASNIKNKILQIIIVMVSVLMILLIGVSRIYLGVHYASDVLAGYLVSLILFLLLDKGEGFKSENNSR